MIIETRVAGPFNKNGYVVGCEETREAVVIDPGDEVDLLLEVVEDQRLSARYILLTHAHLDHITGVERARQVLGAPIGLHRDDDFLYRGVVEQGLAFGFQVKAQPPVDFFYDGPGPWRFGRDDDPARTLFVGDTLFAGSIGRPDLPGGNVETLLRSIREVLFTFPDETPVYSGHGEPTTIGREKRTNPFLR
jgi:hydroxyacylglutathione hydrolase